MASQTFLAIVLDDAVQLGTRTVNYETVKNVELEFLHIGYLKMAQRILGVCGFFGLGVVAHWGFALAGLLGLYLTVIKPFQNNLIIEYRVVFTLLNGEQIRFRTSTLADAENVQARVQEKYNRKFCDRSREVEITWDDDAAAAQAFEVDRPRRLPAATASRQVDSKTAAELSIAEARTAVAPMDVAAVSVYADVLERAGRVSDAEIQWHKVALLDPGNATAAIALCRFAPSGASGENARATLASLAAAKPTDPDIIAWKAEQIAAASEAARTAEEKRLRATRAADADLADRLRAAEANEAAEEARSVAAARTRKILAWAGLATVAGSAIGFGVYSYLQDRAADAENAGLRKQMAEAAGRPAVESGMAPPIAAPAALVPGSAPPANLAHPTIAFQLPPLPGSKTMPDLLAATGKTEVGQLLGLPHAALASILPAVATAGDTQPYLKSYVFRGQGGALELGFLEGKLFRIGHTWHGAPGAQDAFVAALGSPDVTLLVGPSTTVSTWKRGAVAFRTIVPPGRRPDFEWWVCDAAVLDAFEREDRATSEAIAYSDQARADLGATPPNQQGALVGFRKAVTVQPRYARTWLRACKLELELGGLVEAARQDCQQAATRTTIAGVRKEALSILAQMPPP